MKRYDQQLIGKTNQSLVALIGIVALLYFGSPVLIPVALAVLFSFLLAPVVTKLEHLNLKRVPAVVATALVSLIVFGGVSWLITAQVFSLADRLPGYKNNIQKRISFLTSEGQEGTFGSFFKIVQSPTQRSSGESTATTHIQTPTLAESTALTSQPKLSLSSKVSETSIPLPAAEAGQLRSSPLPVEVVERPPNAFSLIMAMLRPMLAPLGTAAVVIVFVLFMLIRREDLRDRFIHLLGRQNLNVTTQAIDEAAQRVSRYLLMNFVVNVSYGIPVALGLYFIGVPYAALWGVMALLLRFIPFIGPLISVCFPLALSLAVFDGWTGPMLTLGLFVLLELVSNNIIEPWLYGSSTGISAVALMVAAVFWSWLWGVPGLFLSTPLTVCLVVMGRYVPALSYLDLLLSDRLELPPAERMYQRLLSMKPEEVHQLAEEYLVDHTVGQLYEEVLVPALGLAEEDRHRGEIDAPRQRFIIRALGELVEQTADQLHKEIEQAGGLPLDRAAWEQGLPGKLTVLCLAARDEADQLVGSMLVQLLRAQNFHARVLPVRPRGLKERDIQLLAQAEAVIISALPPFAVSHARLICRRLCSECPQQKTIIGLWNAKTDATKGRERLLEVCSNGSRIVTTLAETLAILKDIAQTPVDAGWQQAPIPEDELERLNQLEKLELLDGPAEETLDRVTARLAAIFDAPISLMSLIDTNRQFWISQFGLPDNLAAARCSLRETSVCGHVVAQNSTLVVEDLLRDKRFSTNPFIRQSGLRFYAGAPLRTDTGHAVGSLCIIDTKPRRISETEKQMLQLVADEVMEEIQLRRALETVQGNSQTPLSQTMSPVPRELSAAFRRRLLPDSLVTGDGYEVRTLLRTASTEAAELLHLVYAHGGKVCIVLADLPSHGIEATLLSAIALATLHQANLPKLDAQGILETLLKEIHPFLEGIHIPLLVATYEPDSRGLCVSSSSNPQPILLRKSKGRVLEAQVTKGITCDHQNLRREISMKMQPDDLLIFSTDGIANLTTGNGDLLTDFELSRLLAEARFTIPEEQLLEQVCREGLGLGSNSQVPVSFALVMLRCIASKQQ